MGADKTLHQEGSTPGPSKATQNPFSRAPPTSPSKDEAQHPDPHARPQTWRLALRGSAHQWISQGPAGSLCDPGQDLGLPLHKRGADNTTTPGGGGGRGWVGRERAKPVITNCKGTHILKVTSSRASVSSGKAPLAFWKLHFCPPPLTPHAHCTSPHPQRAHRRPACRQTHSWQRGPTTALHPLPHPWGNGRQQTDSCFQ